MRPRNPIVIFWFAVVVDVIALGVGWSAWKAPAPHIATGTLAAVVVVAATAVAGRILAVVTRAKRRT